MNVKFEYGCVMAILGKNFANEIVKFGNKLIPDDDLYFEEGQEYGREKEPHVTIKFGLTDNYSKEDMGKVISHIKPFTITLVKIGIFNNEKFDVVKVDCESPTLRKLNKLFSKLPNEDEHKTYNPHLTLAYVLPGKGKKYIRSLSNPIEVNINRMKYSNPVGKYYYDL